MFFVSIQLYECKVKTHFQGAKGEKPNVEGKIPILGTRNKLLR